MKIFNNQDTIAQMAHLRMTIANIQDTIAQMTHLRMTIANIQHTIARLKNIVKNFNVQKIQLAKTLITKLLMILSSSLQFNRSKPVLDYNI